jgi:ABC-type xylose transport system substrate-binding protein
MARGAVQAVQAGGLADRHVFIAGADADAANVNYVCEGKQSVEVLKAIQPIAEEAATVAAALVDGKTVDAATNIQGVPAMALPVMLVTSENAKALLIDSGFHTQSDLVSCK